MKKLTIEIEGKTDGDIEIGLDEALKRFRQGNTEGFDSNDDGSFHFKVEGEEEPDVCEECEGVGFLLGEDEDSGPEIHRCGSCEKYLSDAEATVAAFQLAADKAREDSDA